MTIKEYRKDINSGDDHIVEVQRGTNKSDVHEKKQVKLYRVQNGEKIEYIEKTEN